MSRILVLVEDEDMRLLVCRLLKRHKVLSSIAAAEAAEGFELGILDHAAFNAHEAWVAQRKTQAHPIFLPFLLLVPALEETIASGRAWRSIDDTVQQPIERSVILRRVSTLLRTRRLSLALQQQNDELQQRYQEQAVLQRRLVGKNIEMERLSQQKDEWLGTAAHDLRIPLGIIHFYSKLLLDESADMAAEERDFIARIQSSSRFMRQLVDEMLDLAGIESGKLNLQTEVLDLGQLVRYNADFHRPLAAQKGISLEVETAVEGLRVVADPDRLEQVLNNLVSNAVKFSRAGDRVRIRVEAGDQRGRVAVEDEGCGIAAERLPHLFKPFVQGTKGTAGEKSTGLGLAIVRKVVEAQDGRVGVESAAGKGSTFWVELPLAVAAPVALEQAVEEWTPTGEVFDREAALARYGDAAALARAVETLRQQRAQRLEALREALARRNDRALAHSAYLLSRLLSGLSAGSALDAALRLQKLGRSGKLDGAEKVYAALERELERLEAALAAA